MQPFAPKAKALPIELYSVQEPQVRIELTTARLQIECSTSELLWQQHYFHSLHSILLQMRFLREKRQSVQHNTFYDSHLN